MATEQSQEYAQWRAIQKERERERRRMRDRQRRQSMSVEEREKHLARRRRNYQLRRQRAANAQSGFHQQVNLSTETAAAAAELSIRNDSQALCVSEPHAQPDCAKPFASSEANQVQNTSAVKYGIMFGEAALPGSYKYPQRLRVTQIKHLARLLYSSANKPFMDSQETGVHSINGDIAAPKGIPRKGIRLIHLKHLTRVLNSKMGITSRQNDSDKMQGGEKEAIQREIEATMDGALASRQTIDAIDEDGQIFADNI